MKRKIAISNRVQYLVFGVSGRNGSLAQILVAKGNELERVKKRELKNMMEGVQVAQVR